MQNLELNIIQFLDEINKDTLKIIKLGNMLPNLIRNFYFGNCSISMDYVSAICEFRRIF